MERQKELKTVSLLPLWAEGGRRHTNLNRICPQCTPSAVAWWATFCAATQCLLTLAAARTAVQL